MNLEPKEILVAAFLVMAPTAFVCASLWLLRARKKTVIVGTVATVIVFVSLHVFSLDGFDGMVFRSLTPDDTQFAANYSALGFWRVREGMTPEQVRALAGPPLEEYPLAGGYGWRWSRSPHDSNYRIRVVIFVGGRVFEKFSEYYLD